MASRFKTALVPSLLAMVLSTMFTSVASATPAGEPSFDDEGLAAGLSSTQVSYLQEQSNFYLANMGGKRVGLNQVDVNENVTVRIALPGEDQPRDFGSSGGAQSLGPPCNSGGAPYLYFCAFKYESFTGDSIAMFDCKYYSIPWVTKGSWHNNQTAGTQPMFYFSNTGSELMSGAPDFVVTNVTWNIITQIRPCPTS